MLTYREEGGVRRSLSRAERDRVALKEQTAKSVRKGTWLSSSEELQEAAGFSEQNRGRDRVYKPHFPSHPIPPLPFSF